MGLGERYRGIKSRLIGESALKIAQDAQTKGYATLPAGTRVDLWITARVNETGKTPVDIRSVTLFSDQDVTLHSEQNLKVSAGEISFTPDSQERRVGRTLLAVTQTHIKRRTVSQDNLILHERDILNEQLHQIEEELRQKLIKQIPARKLRVKPTDVMDVTLYNVRRLKNPRRRNPAKR